MVLPIISFAHIFGISVIENGVWILVISLLLSYLTYRYVEIYTRKQTDFKIIVGVFFLVVLTAGIGLLIKQYDGFPNRSHIESIQEKNQFIRSPAKNDFCIQMSVEILQHQPKFDYCKSTSRSIADKYIAIIGDSHAHVLYPGFKKELAEYGINTLLLANSGCASFIGAARGKNLTEVDKCRLKTQKIYKVLDNLPNLTKVIIVARGPKYIYEKGFGEIDSKVPGKYASFYTHRETYNPESVYMESLDTSINYLTQKDKDVYVFLENP